VSLPRPVFITRRFWPCFDGAGRSIAELVAGLAARGAECTVLTALDHPRWPRSIRCRGVAVERIAAAPCGGRSEARFARALAGWLRARRDRYDVVCVSSLGEDALTAIRAVGRDAPVVLRAERAGRHGDCFAQVESRRGRRIKQVAMTAAALVGTSAQTYEELLAAGYPRKRVHAIPHGVPTRPPRTDATRAEARAALAESSPALDVPRRAPLVVWAGRLDATARLDLLVAAWRPLAAAGPEVQLWLAGEGPGRGPLARQIAADGLEGSVLPVGLFDSIELLLEAADLFVLPAPRPDLSVAILEAMAAGLPVVAADVPAHRQAVIDGRHGLLFPPEDAGALSAAIRRLLDQPDLAAQLGAAAQARVAADFSMACTLDAYAALFDQVV